jgi:hypothetical protein
MAEQRIRAETTGGQDALAWAAWWLVLRHLASGPVPAPSQATSG